MIESVITFLQWLEWCWYAYSSVLGLFFIAAVVLWFVYCFIVQGYPAVG